jgi:hypothetical protein
MINNKNITQWNTQSITNNYHQLSLKLVWPVLSSYGQYYLHLFEYQPGIRELSQDGWLLVFKKIRLIMNTVYSKRKQIITCSKRSLNWHGQYSLLLFDYQLGTFERIVTWLMASKLRKVKINHKHRTQYIRKE